MSQSDPFSPRPVLPPMTLCVADDTYIMSGDPRHLQGIINIVGHYSKRYRVVFGADKTKVTVTGSKHDMSYYQDITMWSLAGKTLTVAEDNDHLGLIVSGLDEEIKNIDKNIDSARQTLFGHSDASYPQQYYSMYGLYMWTRS